MILDRRVFMDEDTEILISTLAQLIKKDGGSKESWERRVRWEGIPEDIKRIIEGAFEIAFSGEGKA